MERVGCRVTDGFAGDEAGAPTDSYRAAQHSGAAPLSALGAFRVGEDGRLYFTGKSEHYQIPLGHGFPGYALIDRAPRAGRAQRHAQQHPRLHHPHAGAPPDRRGQRPAP